MYVFWVFFGTKARVDLHERLKRSARMHFDSLSLLKVESTVRFQRKRRRERSYSARTICQIWYKVGKYIAQINDFNTCAIMLKI